MLCHKINKQLNISFCRINELSLQLKEDNSLSFSRYLYKTPETETEYYLLANKGTEGFLIPEMKRVDYFIIIKNYIDPEDLDSFIEGINKLPEVVVAVEVNPEKLKSKENLIF